MLQTVSDDPLIRFIKATEAFNLKVPSCLFTAYHALKGDIRSGKITMHSSGWLNASWSVFANAIKAEAGELQLATRAFSVPQFIQFLLNGRPVGPTNNSLACQDAH